MFQVSPWRLSPPSRLRGRFSTGYFIQMLSVPAMEKSSTFASSHEMQTVHLRAESMARYIGGGYTSSHFGSLHNRGGNA